MTYQDDLQDRLDEYESERLERREAVYRAIEAVRTHNPEDFAYFIESILPDHLEGLRR